MLPKITIFDLIIPGQVLYMTVQRNVGMSHDFVRGQSVAVTCFSHYSRRDYNILSPNYTFIQAKSLFFSFTWIGLLTMILLP